MKPVKKQWLVVDEDYSANDGEVSSKKAALELARKSAKDNPGELFLVLETVAAFVTDEVSEIPISGK